MPMWCSNSASSAARIAWRMSTGISSYFRMTRRCVANSPITRPSLACRRVMVLGLYSSSADTCGRSPV